LEETYELNGNVKHPYLLNLVHVGYYRRTTSVSRLSAKLSQNKLQTKVPICAYRVR